MCNDALTGPVLGNPKLYTIKGLLSRVDNVEILGSWHEYPATE